MIIWKRAVTCRGEFAQHALRQEKLHKGWWPFSYQILKQLEHEYSPQDEPLLERMYKSLAAGTNICKITRRCRFTDFDARLVPFVNGELPSSTEILIHDMGASNAITSLELYQQFRKERSIQLVASDYYDQLALVDIIQPRWPRTRWTVAFDPLNSPVQTTGLGAIFGTRLYPWRYALSRLVQYWVNRGVIPAARQMLYKNDPGRIQHVTLFHPEAVKQARTDPRFQLIRHDIFQPNPVHCHIVRAMNVVTPRHFSREQTSEAIRASTHNLIEGGWLILGRSIDEEDGRLRATVYQWKEGKLCPRWHHNEGYEWPDLVTMASC